MPALYQETFTVNSREKETSQTERGTLRKTPKMRLKHLTVIQIGMVHDDTTKPMVMRLAGYGARGEAYRRLSAGVMRT